MRVTTPAPTSAPAANPTSSSSTSTQQTYTAAKAGEALRRGHEGPDVLALQKQLNAAGADPALKLDGKLGPKTEAALFAATRSTTLDESAKTALAAKVPASDGPTTPGSARPSTSGDSFEVSNPKISRPALPAASISVDASRPPSEIAARAVEYAQSQNGSIDPRVRGADGHYQGWDKLRDVFTGATGVPVSDKEVQKNNQPLGKAWCGIWATHVLQSSGANVKWDLTKGKMTGDVAHTLAPRWKDPASYKVERAAFEQSIRPGDVITLNGKLNHHAVVTGVNADGTVTTMDGNKPHVGPASYKLADVTSFYRAGAPGSSTSTPASASSSGASSSSSAPSGGLKLETAGDSGGGGMSTRAQAEAAVKARTADMAKPSTTAEIAQNPSAFIARTPQVDGDMKSKDDAVVCGTMATMYGMIAGRPESLKEMATKLVDGNGVPTEAGKREFPNMLANPAACQALLHIRNDQIAPKDVQTVARAMLPDVGTTEKGATAASLIGLRGKIARLGVAVPRYELQQYGDPKGGMGHWRVGVNGNQYSPWPGKDGKAEVITDGSGIAKGSADMPGWKLREKVYVDGNHAHHLMYSVVANGKTIFTPTDPPLISLHYDRTDTTWNRSSNDVTGFVNHKDTPESVKNDVHAVVSNETPSSIWY